MSLSLIYDFNNDGTVNGADVVYFASNIAGVPGFNINNIDETTTNKLVQYKHYNVNNTDTQYVDVSSVIVNDFSLNITPAFLNSIINVSITLNYLTSCYPNTFLKLELYYNTNGIDVSFGEYILGTENTSFMKSTFNANIMTEPVYDNLSEINYFIKASIYSEPSQNGNTMDYSNLGTIEYQPQILLKQFGNSIILQELQ